MMQHLKYKACDKGEQISLTRAAYSISSEAGVTSTCKTAINVGTGGIGITVMSSGGTFVNIFKSFLEYNQKTLKNFNVRYKHGYIISFIYLHM